MLAKASGKLRKLLIVGSALAIVGGTCATAQTAPPALKPIGDGPIADRKAPNILIVLTDDVGFGAASTFGGPIPTPNLDAMAAQGLIYNRFHTTAMCSPTRAALLTGRNHHRVEMGGIVNLAVGEPGYTSVIPKSAATIGRVLQLGGYNTAWFGKNHLTPEWEQTAAGPFDRWPNGHGFDYFYGFMNGAIDQFNPMLFEDHTAIDPASKPDYILDNDLANRAVGWIGKHHNAAPDKPFMIYLAPGSAHEPHQAPAAWLERFRGKYDMGWDAMREETFARQKARGVIPQNTVLTPRPDALPAWNSLSPGRKRVAARMMEAHAAQRAYFDDQFGRIVAELKRTGKWDNTLVMFIDGDNGSSGEGAIDGTLLGVLNFPTETPEYQLANIDKIGGPLGASNYPAAWGWAMNAPFPWFKQIASHLGGTRDGMVVSWPARIKDGGAVRGQYGHVNDVAATVYEAAGITPPAVVDGVKQMPFDGVSLAYSFTAPTAPSRHRVQYYEMLGNAAIYRDGWLASRTPPNLMWVKGARPPKTWQLFNLEMDFSQSRDVAAENPAMLASMKAEYAKAEKANHFRTLEASIMARGNPAMRPSRFNGRTTFTYRASENPISDYDFPEIVNRNWSVTVPIELSSGKESGTLISQGGYPYGWGLYLFDGKPALLYRNEPSALVRLASATPLAPGRHKIDFSLVRSSPKPGGPATLSLRIDDGAPMQVQMPGTVPFYWGANGVGIGREVGSPISDAVAKPFIFTGGMGDVTLRFDP